MPEVLQPLLAAPACSGRGSSVDFLSPGVETERRQVLLVGGGQVATRKARLLARAGARPAVLAPDIQPELAALLAQTGGDWEQVNTTAQVSAKRCWWSPPRPIGLSTSRYPPMPGPPHSGERGRCPELCTVVFPAIVDRSPSPSPFPVAVTVRCWYARCAAAWRRCCQLPTGGRAVAGRLREPVRMAIPRRPRRLFWEQAMDGAVAELVLAGGETRAEELVRGQLADVGHLHRGEVYLLGAGPGDPDLLTFGALRLLQSADVVLYDRLVAPAIVDLARRDAEQIYVGKSRADHALPQGQINTLLLTLAQQGKRVVRLKRGDPFHLWAGWGRNRTAGAASHSFPGHPRHHRGQCGSLLCVGIPLTHRDHAQSVRFVAGHLRDGSLDHDWTQFLSEQETLVFYMALVGLPVICEELQRHGRSADTPSPWWSAPLPSNSG